MLSTEAIQNPVLPFLLPVVGFRSTFHNHSAVIRIHLLTSYLMQVFALHLAF